MDGQRDEVIRSLSGCGRYWLCTQFNCSLTLVLKCSKMRPDQRKKIIADFDSMPLKAEYIKDNKTSSHSKISSLQLPTKPAGTSISADDSGIETIPLVTLHGVWDKTLNYFPSIMVSLLHQVMTRELKCFII